MEDFKKEFPVLKEYTYLNTASCGLISQSVTDWRRSHDEKMLQGGSVFRDTHRTQISSIKNTVGSFWDALENEIALVPNFSFGLNTLLDGLPKGLKVLLLDQDYPSINWAVENRGFELCYASVSAKLEDGLLKAIEKNKPDVLALSIVQYLSGLKIDFEFLKQIKSKYPNMLLIGDGTQYLGTSRFSFAESPFDVVGASCYKWMLAGYGNGVFMVKEQVQDRILPKSIGFNSAEAAYSKKDSIAFIKRFEPGHQDILNYGSLERAIQAFNDFGIKTIERRAEELSGYAKDRLMEVGLIPSYLLERNEHSTIFNIEGDALRFQKLKEQNIICSQRGNGIRVSFHFYNAFEDIDHLVSVLRN